jgi:hypothetical protein
VRIAPLTVLLLATTLPAAADARRERLFLFATEWAGMNCGSALPMADYMAALRQTQRLSDDEAAQERLRVKLMLEDIKDREEKCEFVMDVLRSRKD